VLALFGTMAASIAEANEVRAAQPQTEAAYPSIDSFTPSREALSELGLSEEEIDFYLNLEDSDITIADGVLYDKDGNVIDDESELATFGFWGAAKAFLPRIRSALYRLPAWVIERIGGKGPLKVILNVVEAYFGVIETAIYNACMVVLGWMYGSNNLCWFIAKTTILLM